MNKTDIKKMSIIERLQAMEILWDSLIHEEDEMTSPNWHESILEKRKKRIENGNAKFLILDQLKNLKNS